MKPLILCGTEDGYIPAQLREAAFKGKGSFLHIDCASLDMVYFVQVTWDMSPQLHHYRYLNPLTIGAWWVMLINHLPQVTIAMTWTSRGGAEILCSQHDMYRCSISTDQCFGESCVMHSVSSYCKPCTVEPNCDFLPCCSYKLQINPHSHLYHDMFWLLLTVFSKHLQAA